MDGRPLDLLPKAHLHLHFTGSLRPATLLELADESGIRLPDALVAALSSDRPAQFDGTDRGWFRFQRLYDAARSVVRTESAVRRLVIEAAEDDRREGSGWLEIQVDPTSYAPWLGGLTPALELVLDSAREATDRTGVGVGRDRRRQPDPPPARRPDAGPARSPLRRRGRRGIRAVQRRAARQHRVVRAGLPDRPRGRTDRRAARR